MYLLTAISLLSCSRVYYRHPFEKNPFNWTLPGGNLENTNFKPFTILPPFLKSWEYDASAGFGQDAVSYSDSLLFASNLIGEVYVINTNTGKGSRIADFGTAITGMPVIENDKMYVALTQTKESLIAYNLITNDIVWHAELGDIETTPLLLDDRLYTATLDGQLICLNKQSGSIIWRFTVPSKNSINPIHSTPCSNGHLIIFGCDNGNLYAVGMEDGKLRWHAKTNGSILASPSIGGNKVYVGSLDSTFYAFDLESGEQIWKQPLCGKIFSSQAVSSERVYVGTAGRTVYCFSSENGQIIWKTDVNGAVKVTPLLAGNILYIGSLDKILYAIESNTGNIIDRYKTDGRIKTQPIAGRQNLFLCIEDRSIIALKPSTSQ